MNEEFHVRLLILYDTGLTIADRHPVFNTTSNTCYERKGLSDEYSD
jgi:hypothetical protein